MAPPDIPAEIRAFIADRIDTVPQLEALLMMSASPEVTWTVEEISARTYINLPAARLVLESLQGRGLVAPDAAAGGYRFDPVNPADTALVARVGEFYRSNLVLVATTIHDKASASVREFARAFDFKKEH
jgi:DNA-binding IclR family transcriptional regulator